MAKSMITAEVLDQSVQSFEKEINPFSRMAEIHVLHAESNLQYITLKHNHFPCF